MQCVMAESARFPELAQVYFASGPGRATEELTRVLERAQERGEIIRVDSRRAAEIFMGMLRGNVYFESLLRVRPLPDEQEKKTFAEVAVDIFLRGMNQGGNCL